MINPLHSAPAANRAARDTRKRSLRLFNFGCLGLAALVAYYAVTTKVDDPITLYQGLGILILAFLPTLFWARRGTSQLPVFAVFMLTTASTYAFPLLNGRADLKAYPPDVVFSCGLIVLFFQLVTLATHTLVRGRPGRSRFYTAEVLSRPLQKYVMYGLGLATVYTFWYVFYEDTIPYELNSVLRAVFYGLSIVCTFLQARRWGQGDLSSRERAILVLLIVAQVIMQFSTLLLVGGISILILALIGYISGGRRFPIAPAVALVALVALLHNGKSAMRARYWPTEGDHLQVAPTALVPFFTEWIGDGLTLRRTEGGQNVTKELLDRTSLFQILCLIVYNTPDRVPFLQGLTYGQIPAQFVPRFFWPGKPPGHISTYTLAITYGLQTAEDTKSTTIGFGLLPEAYANFGYFGAGLLGLVAGAFYKKVEVATARSPLLSYPGLFLVVLIAWSFQTEFTLSIWLSSMFQACVAIMGIPFLVRNLLGLT